MAKKLFVLNNLLLALVLLNGDTSVWEGASAPDVYDSLPGRGFYVSTSFFPRNTVVDVTSLETGKTIQVIVADNSSSPGNGVILSRDAADALGVGKRSSMRIRMSPPSDTTAFSRFSDGRSFSGDPDYDPRAFIRANTLPVETQALSASPYGNRQEAPYTPTAGSPPPVSIIPDQAGSGTAVADASRFELPNTALPLTAPSEPVTIFMPAPVPTAVTVDSPPGVTAPDKADVPKGEVYTPAAEVPEVYEMPPTPGTGHRTGRPYYSETAATALSNGPEPETPFPDVVVPSRNPIDYQGAPRMALNEAVIDESVITKPVDTTAVMTDANDTETTPEQAAQHDDIPETSLAYAEPYETDAVRLVEGDLNTQAGKLGAESALEDADDSPSETDLPETAYPEGSSDESGPGDLYEAPFREEVAEASLAYAEPDAEALIALTDEEWTIADEEIETAYTEYAPVESGSGDLYDALFSEDAAEASLAYAEPDAEALIALADGYLILEDKENADELYLLSPLDETAAPLREPDFMQQDDLYDTLFSEDAAEANLAYAEPEADDLIALADGPMILRDKENADELYLLPPLDETVAPLREPDFTQQDDLYDELLGGDTAQTTLARAEPEADDLIALADGSLILEDKENTDELYLLPPLDETVAPLREPDFTQQDDLYDELLGGDTAQTTLARAEPEEDDLIALADGSLILEDRTIADILRLLQFPQETAGTLREPDFSTDADVSQPYTEPRDKYDLLEAIPPEYQASLQELYDAIVRLESDAEAPQMVDIGPAGEEHTAMLPLPEDMAAAELGGRKAYLMFIKNLSSGKYYLQIGVFNQKEALVRRLASLNWVYPYALETSGTMRSPMYKLLVGPVNEGESNALLLRFKREGFSGAFIRREG